jgi:FkbM family methyltransferase
MYLEIKHYIKVNVFQMLLQILQSVFKFEFYEYNLNKIRVNLLKNANGVIHIGGSTGQEAQVYSNFKLRVIWVECLPDIFEILKKNVSHFENQSAINYLLGNEPKEVEFFLTSNNFMSSSIYKLNVSNQTSKDLREVGTEKMKMVRLDSLFSNSEMLDFTHWVLDVQGAELDVLRGAGALLESCQSIELEYSNYEVYLSAPSAGEVVLFLEENGFVQLLDTPLQFHGNVIFVRGRTV